MKLSPSGEATPITRPLFSIQKERPYKMGGLQYIDLNDRIETYNFVSHIHVRCTVIHDNKKLSSIFHMVKRFYCLSEHVKF